MVAEAFIETPICKSMVTHLGGEFNLLRGQPDFANSAWKALYHPATLNVAS
jgi:hypothetical protein